MSNRHDEDLDFPFYDPNPRRVLETCSKEIKEKPIKGGSTNESQIEASPQMLALSIMAVSQNHLNFIVDNASQIDVQINKEQKKGLYLEILTLYYFLVGHQLGKYLLDDQFTLFLLKLHVELLDNLPQTRDTWWLFGLNPLTRPMKIKEIVGEDCWKAGLSYYIQKGEKFYIKDELNDEESKGIDNLKPFLLGEHKNDYEKNLMLQFLIKSFYLLTKTLNLSTPEQLVAIMTLYSANSTSILENQGVLQNIRPVWHIRQGGEVKTQAQEH